MGAKIQAPDGAWVKVTPENFDSLWLKGNYRSGRVKILAWVGRQAQTRKCPGKAPGVGKKQPV